VTAGVFGVPFGVLAVGAGLSVLQTCAMSALVLTGATQFAAVGVIAAGGSPIAAVASGLLLGLRNAAYGLALAPIFPKRLVPRILATQLVFDETTAVSLAHPDRPYEAFFATGISAFVFWNLGTFAGAALGSSIGDPATFGLDAAFPASLLALTASRFRERRALVAALTGGAIALILTPLLPPGLPIILAGLAVLPHLRAKDVEA
jgi:predicted branched-subunit amino acid permease